MKSFAVCPPTSCVNQQSSDVRLFLNNAWSISSFPVKGLSDLCLFCAEIPVFNSDTRAPVAQLVECLLWGTGGHRFNPGP